MRRVLAGALQDLCFVLTWFLAPLLGRRRVLLFGPPIITLKYIKQSVVVAGYDALTFVKYAYAINRSEDFDIVSRSIPAFFIELARSQYCVIFFDSLDSFFGPIGRRLLPLYKRMFKRYFVALPYGGDAFVYSEIPDQVLRHALMISYRSDARKERQLKRRIATVDRVADIVVGCLVHTVNLPRWDILPVHYYPVDLGRIKAIQVEKYPRYTVLHAPNHRGVKGTELIIRAVQELQREGIQLDLRLLEGMANDEVLVELKRSHLLVEQLIMGGYALSAMEGMAAGLPVITHLSREVSELFNLYSFLADCPIVNVERNVASLKSAIRHCMANQDELGARSLAYVSKYHSVETMAIMWGAILDACRTKRDLTIFFDPLIGEFSRRLEVNGTPPVSSELGRR
jgi:glycosyltransferase involved in cell wall biosynthesis